MRNQQPLTSTQIAKCINIWNILGGDKSCGILVITYAETPGSKTKYNESRKLVLLGADVYPNLGAGPAAPTRDRLSVMAVLAHELAHAERHAKGYNRPYKGDDLLIDEAEASLEASFNPALENYD